MELPAMYFIAFKLIIWDNVFEPRFLPPMQVAYGAHLAGYAFGVAATVGLLATKLVSSSSFDLWAMIKRWNRRRLYRDVVSGGYDPFAARPARQVRAKEVVKSAAEITERLTQRNLPAGAALYLDLMALDDQQVLPRQQLLDIANQLAGENNHAEAARAYEQFLAHYGSNEYAGQVELMLGILYSRYLNRTEPAIRHLDAAVPKLADPGQLKMCRDELGRLQT
jgi:hypothetical protein